jgi:Tfp pilus assembly protein PilF
MNYIGYAWTQKGVRLNDAERLLKRALGLRPDNGYIQDSWGWYLFTRGRVREAVVELEKAAKLKPNEPTILEHLGDAYLRANLVEKAFIQYSDAARYADDETARKKVLLKADGLKRELVKGRQDLLSEQQRYPASEKVQER